MCRLGNFELADTPFVLMECDADVVVAAVADVVADDCELEQWILMGMSCSVHH